MIGGAKGMIAGCIDRRTADGCGGCERRDACADLFAMLGLRPPGERARPRPQPRGESGPRDMFGSIFRSVVGEVAKAVERRTREARAEASSRAAAAAFAEDPPEKTRRETRTATPKSAPGAFQRSVEAHLEPLLAEGRIGVESVARALGYSRQTLYRRLKAEGVTFEEVLDGLRRRLALRFIREDGLSVKDAAYRLGFSDPAAFSRAFKRWTGASPNHSKRRK